MRVGKKWGKKSKNETCQPWKGRKNNTAAPHLAPADCRMAAALWLIMRVNSRRIHCAGATVSNTFLFCGDVA